MYTEEAFMKSIPNESEQKFRVAESDRRQSNRRDSMAEMKWVDAGIFSPETLRPEDYMGRPSKLIKLQNKAIKAREEYFNYCSDLEQCLYNMCNYPPDDHRYILAKSEAQGLLNG